MKKFICKSFNEDTLLCRNCNNFANCIIFPQLGMDLVCNKQEEYDKIQCEMENDLTVFEKYLETVDDTLNLVLASINSNDDLIKHFNDLNRLLQQHTVFSNNVKNLKELLR